MVTNLPQPSFYLYYMRLKNKKIIQNGRDRYNSLQNLPQPFNYLYYMRMRNKKMIKNGSDEYK